MLKGGSALDPFSWGRLGRADEVEPAPLPSCRAMRQKRRSALECRPAESRPNPPTLSPPETPVYRAACSRICCWRTWATLDVKMLVTEKCCAGQRQVRGVDQVWIRCGASVEVKMLVTKKCCSASQAVGSGLSTQTESVV